MWWQTNKKNCELISQKKEIKQTYKSYTPHLCHNFIDLNFLLQFFFDVIINSNCKSIIIVNSIVILKQIWCKNSFIVSFRYDIHYFHLYYQLFAVICNRHPFKPLMNSDYHVRTAIVRETNFSIQLNQIHGEKKGCKRKVFRDVGLQPR